MGGLRPRWSLASGDRRPPSARCHLPPNNSSDVARPRAAPSLAPSAGQRWSGSARRAPSLMSPTGWQRRAKAIVVFVEPATTAIERGCAAPHRVAMARDDVACRCLIRADSTAWCPLVSERRAPGKLMRPSTCRRHLNHNPPHGGANQRPDIQQLEVDGTAGYLEELRCASPILCSARISIQAREANHRHTGLARTIPAAVRSANRSIRHSLIRFSLSRPAE